MSELAPGSVVAGKYELLSRLGRGGFGTVWRVRHRDLDQDMALKVLNPEITGSKDAQHRFLKEVKTNTSFVHKYAVQLREFGRDPDLNVLYFSMDLVEGPTLEEVLRKEGRLRPERAVRIASQVLEVLEEAHKRGIAHRDLKPANLILTDGWGAEEVRVLDFGIAKALSTSPTNTSGITLTGTTVGTLSYMSPEQAQGSELDGRSDLYSVGVLLFECLSGQRPIEASPEAKDPIRSLLTNLLVKPPRELSELSPGLPQSLVQTVMKTLAKDPDERFPDARTLREELQKTGPVGDTTDSFEPTGVRLAPSQPQRWARNLLLLSGILLIIGAIIVIAYRPAAPDPKVEHKVVELSPADGAYTRTRTILIRGRIDPAGPGTVRVQGHRESLAADGSFSIEARGLEPGTNTIVVHIEPMSGDPIAREIEVTLDGNVPKLSLDTPPDDTTTTDPTILVKGRVKDASLAEVRVNDQQVTTHAGPFRAEVPLSMGPTEIVVMARDRAGGRTIVRRRVTRVAPAIVLRLDSPLEGALLSKNTVLVAGSVRGPPGREVELELNGSQVPTSEGKFSSRIDLQDGQRVITLQARSGDLEASTRRTVRVDSTPPTLTLDSPAQGADFTADRVRVAGRVEDASSVEVTVDDEGVEHRSGAFETEVPLPPNRSSEIEVIAKDEAGHTTTVKRTVHQVPARLDLSLTHPPQAESWVRTGRVLFKGRIDTNLPLAELEVRVGDKTISPNPAGGYERTLDLPEGKHVIEVVARATSDKSKPIRRIVHVDLTQPRLELYPARPHDSSVRVSGEAQDANLSRVTVNGRRVEPGKFSRDFTLGPGEKLKIEVVARDRAGNETVKKQTIEGPAVVIGLKLDEPSQEWTNTGRVSVSGRVSGNLPSSDLGVRIQGETVPVGSGNRFSKTLRLREGTHEIRVAAYRKGGREVQVARRTVKVDLTKPRLDLTVPRAAPGYSVPVKGRATDRALESVIVNGARMTLEPDGTFSNRIRLRRDRRVEVVARDRAGNETTESRIVDRARPEAEIQLDDPRAGAWLSGRRTHFKGRLKSRVPVSDLSVKIEGTEIELRGDYTFHGRVRLPEGKRTITVQVFSKGKSIKQLKRSIHVDRTLPELRVSFGLHGGTTKSKLTVTGMVRDRSPCELRYEVNGRSGVKALPSMGPAHPVLASLDLHLGENAIKLVAVDKAGNASRKVTYKLYRHQEYKGVDLFPLVPGRGWLYELKVNGQVMPYRQAWMVVRPAFNYRIFTPAGPISRTVSVLNTENVGLPQTRESRLFWSERGELQLVGNHKGPVPPILWLPQKIEIGMSWTVKLPLESTTYRILDGGLVKAPVPGSPFRTIGVQFVTTRAGRIVQTGRTWYAPRVGVIRFVESYPQVNRSSEVNLKAIK